MKAIPSLFTRYELSPEEELAAAAFTELQRAFIHNERAIAAEQKVTIGFDPTDVVGTARRDGFYQGMMSAYAFLLETDSSARRTCSKSLSTMECAATVLMPSSLHARKTRKAISPRLAMRILSIMCRSSCYSMTNNG